MRSVIQFEHYTCITYIQSANKNVDLVTNVEPLLIEHFKMIKSYQIMKVNLFTLHKVTFRTTLEKVTARINHKQRFLRPYL